MSLYLPERNKNIITLKPTNNMTDTLIRNICGAACIAAAASCSTGEPSPYGALPSQAQIEWQKMETNMFCHFGPNTFTSAEWGTGQESADLFNPSGMDCRQWAAIAKAAGMKGIIITAKHHDGFCLWPNPVSRHTTAQSSWKDGKGDVLKELSEACREYGLKFGVYISPWDRNDPAYGTDEYNEVFRKTLESALGSYGPVFEQWFDGACGEGPNGKVQVYDWDLYHETVYSLQPDAIIFSDTGPGCRWIGNEAGYAGKTCWSTLDTTGYAPGAAAPSRESLNCGDANGKAWIPGEADVSIRPGWFYKDSENDKVKSVSDLLGIYYASVGRNSLLLLNVPPDKRGLIHSTDSLRLMEFRAALDKIFADDLAEGATAEATQVRGGHRKFSASNVLDGNYDSYWATDDGTTQASFTVSLNGKKTFNRIMLQEYIPLGQRIAEFSVEIRDNEGNWKKAAEGTTIGYKRILLTDMITTDAVRVNIDKAYACPLINGFGLYLDEIMGETRAWDEPDDNGRAMAAGEKLTFDAGRISEAEGFFYQPRKKGTDGCIISYDLEISTDGKQWTKVFSDKMFENIVNNPIRQDVYFPEPVELRYIRLTPLRTDKDGAYGVTGFGNI